MVRGNKRHRLAVWLAVAAAWGMPSALGIDPTSEPPVRQELSVASSAADATPDNPESRFVAQHWKLLGAAALLAVLTLIAMWIVALNKRNAMKKINYLFGRLPFRIGVAEENGKILSYHAAAYGGTEVWETYSHIDQIPDGVAGLFRKSIAEALRSDRNVEVDYSQDGCHRHVVFMPLPRSLFGRRTVMWAATDVTALKNAHIEQSQLTERFRLTLEAIGDGVIVTDRNERIELVNPVTAKLTGYSKEELVGSALQERFHLVSYIDQTPVPCPITRALTTGQVVELANHTDLLHKDGSRRHIADSAAPIRNAAGEITGAVLVFRDVTGEYAKRDSINAQNVYLQAAADIAEMTYFSCDANGRLNLDEFPERYWGHDADGRPLAVAAWVHPEDQPAFRRAWSALLRRKSNAVSISYRGGRAADFKYYEMRVKKDTHPVTGQIAFLGIVRDVTQARTVEQKRLDITMMLQAIMDNLPCYVFIKKIDDDFRYLLCNQALARLLHCTVSDIEGRRDSELFDDQEQCARVLDGDVAAVRSGQPMEEVIEFAGKDGIRRKGKMFRLALARANGEPLLLGMVLDITNELNQQEELREHAEQERLLYSVLEQVTLLNDDELAIKKILQTMIHYFDAYAAFVFRSDFETGQDIPAVIYKYDDSPLTMEVPSFELEPEAAWFRLLLARHCYEANDLAQEESRTLLGNWGRQVPAFGVQALFGVGVWKANRLWGHIGFAFKTPRGKLTQTERSLFYAAAHILEIILERQRNRAELNRNEYEKRLIIDSIKIPVLLFDPAMRLVRVNNAACQVAGLPEALIYTQPCYRSFCGKTSCDAGCPAWLTSQDSQEHTRNIQIHGRDYQMSAYPIILDGKLVNVLKTLIDITDFNAIQQQLNQALLEAQNANKAKSFFLATMSHELRTPLNAVIGFSELLQGNDMPREELEDYLHSINLAGNSLLSLINDVLDLSKIEAEQMQIVPQPVEVAAVIREIIAIFRHKAEAKALTLELEAAPMLPVMQLDNLRFRQILLNLIGNAIKFTPTGGVEVKVDFHCDSAEFGTLTITVIDTGIGIKPESLDTIFQPFVQQDADRDSHAFKGTGLGLAISQRLVAKMGGTIQVESEVGRGSKFTVTLNRIQYAAPKQLPKPEATVTAAPPAADWKILLVDDVPMNLKVLSAMLKKVGITPFTASSGAEALELLARIEPDMVLTDIWMPGMNGCELARRIKQECGAAKPRVIALTADTEANDNFEVENFDGLLLKPITLEKLHTLLATLPQV